jgi:hypothetical protein
MFYSASKSSLVFSDSPNLCTSSRVVHAMLNHLQFKSSIYTSGRSSIDRVMSLPWESSSCWQGDPFCSPTSGVHYSHVRSTENSGIQAQADWHASNLYPPCRSASLPNLSSSNCIPALALKKVGFKGKPTRSSCSPKKAAKLNLLPDFDLSISGSACSYTETKISI